MTGTGKHQQPAEHESDDAPGTSWMSVEQAKQAYPDVFTSKGRPEGEYEAMLDFLAEMDCIVAPIARPLLKQQSQPQSQSQPQLIAKEKPDGPANR